DDSFSALDLATDARLRAALVPWTVDATVVLVAQRVSTIINADRILVLEDGEVVGMGTHSELLVTCPTYAEIVASQNKQQQEAAAAPPPTGRPPPATKVTTTTRSPRRSCPDPGCRTSPVSSPATSATRSAARSRACATSGSTCGASWCSPWSPSACR